MEQPESSLPYSQAPAHMYIYNVTIMFLPHRKHAVSITKAGRLMLFFVCLAENYAKDIQKRILDKHRTYSMIAYDKFRHHIY